MGVQAVFCLLLLDKKLFAVGLFNGNPDGTLNPKDTATRVEVVQVLMNYCTVVIDAE